MTGARARWPPARPATGGLSSVRPVPRDPHMPTRPFLDFGAGYLKRSMDQLPRQGDRMPWLTSTDYRSDVKLLRADSVADPELQFSSRVAVPA